MSSTEKTKHSQINYRFSLNLLILHSRAFIDYPSTNFEMFAHTHTYQALALAACLGTEHDKHSSPRSVSRLVRGHIVQQQDLESESPV